MPKVGGKKLAASVHGKRGDQGTVPAELVAAKLDEVGCIWCESWGFC